MVQQILIIPLLCYAAMLAEFICFNIFGRWGDPQILLLVVVFFNLYSGIRYSLLAAVCAGVLKDCFSTMPFGTYVFTFILCAIVSLLVRRFCYERGSDFSKLWMVFCVVTANTLVLGLLHQMTFEELVWRDVWGGVWLPELFATMLVAVFVFKRLHAVAKLLKF